MAVGTQGWTGLALANGRYLITAKLGEGGMGTVYRANDQNIDADVVIKVPLRSMLAEPEFARRFKEEIRSLVRLSHPNIVKVSDVGEHDELPFAVMQFLPGRSLEDRRPVGPGGTFGASDPREVPKWLVGIASALDYVHSQGYVHRDVKPGNILFDGQGHPFLGDFGVVKVIASAADTSAKSNKAAMTGAGMVVGTAEYMAPELIMGERFDGRVDQYALAATVYEMLAGQRPFEDEVKTKVLVLQTTKSPPVLNEVCGWIPSALSQAVLKGLAKDPKDRYPNCAALAAAVVAAVGAAYTDQPVRIRIKCLSCGKSLAIPTKDYDKLRVSGRSVACPACKASIQIPRESTGAGEPPSSQENLRGGTMILTPQENSGEYSLAPAVPSARTMVEQPGLKRPAATMVEQPGLKRPAATMVEQPGLKRPAATMVEQPGLRRPPSTIVEQPGLSRREPTFDPLGVGDRGDDAAALPPDLGPTITTGPAPRRASARPERSQVPLVAVGASAGVVLAIVGFGSFWLLSGAKDEPALPRTSQIKPDLTPYSRSEPKTSGPAVALATPAPSDPTPPTADPDPKDAPSAATKDDGPAGRSLPSTPSAPIVAINDATRLDSARLSMEGGRTVGAPQGRRTVQPPPSEAAEEGPPEFNLSQLKPAKASVPLDKLLKTPALYANQMVTLARTYCISNIYTLRPDGSASLPIREGILDLKFQGTRPSIHTLRAETAKVDIDPKLADVLAARNLVRQSSSGSTNTVWGENVAIVTMGVVKSRGPAPGEWTPSIVKFQFLIDIGPQVVTVARKRKSKVVYKTLTLTRDGDETSEGKAEEWAQQDRLLHIANQFKDLIDKQARLASDAKWNMFNNQVNGMISQGMRDAVIPTAEPPRARRVFP